MSLMSRFLGRLPNSANVAKERLQLVLAHDRANIPPDTLETLKDEIINVISKHIDIDRANVEVSISHGPNGNRLVADIPVRDSRRARKTKNR